MDTREDRLQALLRPAHPQPEGSLWYGHHPLPLDIEDWRTVGTGDQLRIRGLLACFGAAEQPTDFGLPVAAMPTQGADARQLACLGPPGDGLGVNPEQRGHLCRGEQGLGCRPGLNIASGVLHFRLWRRPRLPAPPGFPPRSGLRADLADIARPAARAGA